MLAVRDDPRRVEAELATGRLCCPSCGGSLGPWGWARPRRLRARAGSRRLRPRRTRCRTCHATHVLVSTATLARRSATIEVIGAALAAKRAGLGHRRIADRLGVPAATVRGWLRRFAARADQVCSAATAWAYRLDTALERITARGSPFDAALETLAVAVGAAVRTLGPARSAWHVVSALTGAVLLSTVPLPLP
jgi:transposase-like protein